MRVAYKVILAVPDGATAKDMREYVYDAVTSMKGSYSPEEPVFHLERDSVTVTRMAGKRTRKRVRP